MLTPKIIPPQLLAAGALAALLAGFAGGWTVNGWRYEAAESEALRHAIEAKDDAIAKRDELAKKLADADDTHTKELKDANTETNRLRDCLRTGSCGLRIKARCPSATAAAPGASVDSGPGAELDATAGSAYFALRDGINQVTAQLAACQDQLRGRSDTASATP